MRMTEVIEIGKKKKVEDILIETKKDRRLLPNVPDAKKIRSGKERRGSSVEEEDSISKTRYIVQYPVTITCYKQGVRKQKIDGVAVDVSTSGILVQLKREEDIKTLEESEYVVVHFQVSPGSMPEGYEMKMRVKADFVRKVEQEETTMIALKFRKDLKQKAKEKRGNYALVASCILLAFITLFIMLMRAESVLYFKFNKWLYLYSIVTAAFLLTRYLFGSFYRPVKVDPDYTPSVSIIIPCFNEEEWIQQTILSCMNQSYPMNKLEVIVVDDCSNDKSVEKIKEIAEQLFKEGEEYDISNRLRYIVQEQNGGKREALAKGVLEAKHELVVFVDSDSFLNPDAIRNLVQPFKDPKMGGVAGRTDVANTYTNVLTKMQSVRYYIAFRIMKAAEGYFDAVTCLSGPLACYRKEYVKDNIEAWLSQSFLGQKATFGDDRAMTNFILQKYRTGYQDTAVCSTIVPNKYKVFLKQQMRWKRSWLRESLMAGKFMWKKEPFAAVSFYMGLLVPVLAPIIVVYNIVIAPLRFGIFPTTFLVGMLMMAMMMSVVQLLLRKSTTWLFGLAFCLFYEGVLLWQMPIAWVTFWKSTWGTRMTPSDILVYEKRESRKRIGER
ncbi:glycosyltransferase [Anaerosporobacter sp.]|uniref:glycosyltransferase n=1 Tax=Anaerosporobacter sp. TaxID=1872529 RepID=UPI00286F4A14|nr:glycosyltransferase [Anaerosporobacter sp.]